MYYMSKFGHVNHLSDNNQQSGVDDTNIVTSQTASFSSVDTNIDTGLIERKLRNACASIHQPVVKWLCSGKVVSMTRWV